MGELEVPLVLLRFEKANGKLLGSMDCESAVKFYLSELTFLGRTGETAISEFL